MEQTKLDGYRGKDRRKIMYKIQDVINTLNQVSVCGKENMDRMLGAIMALEVIREAQSGTTAQENEENKGE